MSILLLGFRRVNSLWRRWSIWVSCSSLSQRWVRYDVRSSGGVVTGNPLILSFQESFERTKETSVIKFLMLLVSGCSCCRKSRFFWAHAQRSLIEWISRTLSQYLMVQSGTRSSTLWSCRCLPIKDCDCPISGHLSRFIRRASDGDGRSIISSTLVMFGVRWDRKFEGPG